MRHGVGADSSRAIRKRPTQAKPNLLDPSTLTAQAPETFQVKFVTTKGDFTVVVTRAWAPLGADRFYNLVRAGFFTDAAFFRVIPGFMAQFGISARPEVSAVWQPARIPDDPVKQSNTRGRITFATGGSEHAHHSALHQLWRQLAAGLVHLRPSVR